MSNEEGLKPFSSDREKIKNMVHKSHEIEEGYDVSLIVWGTILVLLGFIPIIGVIVSFFVFGGLKLSRKITDSKIGDFIGIILLSFGVLVSVFSTVYFVYFKLILSQYI